MAEREVKVEDYLKDAVEARGGLCWKLAPVSAVGIPDRLILLPGGRVGFLELKRPGKKKMPTRVQFYWLGKLRDLGFAAGWTETRDGIDQFLRRLEQG